jgi:Methyltransferase domain
MGGRLPYSYTDFDNDLRERILAAYPSPATRILDVGAGAGKMRELLSDYRNMDAVEVWGPTVDRFKLRRRYRKVYQADIRQLDVFSEYDLVLLGDVLEHLTVGEAHDVLGRCERAEVAVVVCVPYGYEQGEVDGNPHEAHRQPDLTHAVFMERYPGFRTLLRNSRYGVYARDPKAEERWLATPESEMIDVPIDDLKRHHVCIATPCYGGELTLTYVVSLLKTHKRFSDLGLRLGQMFAQGGQVHRSRNQMVADFLSRPEFTHLLFIDADQGWDPEAILRLLAMDRELIGVASRKKTPRPQWAVNFLDADQVLIERGAMEVAEVGTGFLLIRRSVFERMMEKYPELRIRTVDEGEGPSPADAFYFQLFQAVLWEDGQERSEDLSFCRRWRNIGGRVWVDPESDLVHVGQQKFSGALSSAVLGLAPKPAESASEKKEASAA